MASFKPTSTATIPSIVEPLSEEADLWTNQLDEAMVGKEFGPVNAIAVNGDDDILVTAANRLAIYEHYSLEMKKTYTAPNFAGLFGAGFRSDNQMVVAGCRDGVVRVWEAKSSRPLRQLGDKRPERHQATVRKAFFYSHTDIVSFSDDKNIKMWDVTDESVKCRFGDKQGAHDDGVRTGCQLPRLSVVVSGSVDKTVKLWDVRTPEKPVHKLMHGKPVESVATRDLVAVSCGGDTIRVFDVVAGKVMKTMTNVNKLITCANFYKSYLLVGSYDGYLKIFDYNYQLVSSLSYVPSKILSCTANDKLLAIGTFDGLVSVRKFLGKAKKKRKEKLKIDEERQFRVTVVDDSMWNQESSTRTITVKDSFGRRRKLPKYDSLLKGFNHSLALDRVLKEPDPEIIVSFFQELIRRSALQAALIGRTDKQLKPIVEFLINNIRDPKFNRILVDVSLILTELYMDQVNRSPKVKEMFKKLDKVVNQELDSMRMMLEVAGQLSSLLNGVNYIKQQ